MFLQLIMLNVNVYYTSSSKNVRAAGFTQNTEFNGKSCLLCPCQLTPAGGATVHHWV